MPKCPLSPPPPRRTNFKFCFQTSRQSVHLFLQLHWPHWLPERTLCAYDQFVAKLENGQRTILSASSTLHAKKAFQMFYLKYVREIQAIAPYHESARFAIDACRRLKKKWIENALNESIRSEVSESLQYLINVRAALIMNLLKPDQHSYIQSINRLLSSDFKRPLPYCISCLTTFIVLTSSFFYLSYLRI
ncbi:unnamed protein product [Rodentolepis nana]|uniref:RGS domain-containing protein n=1 Tax=Rodentolepis nana TaxID=102285 RepID=A0A0R3TJA5_RODNA|nr:unnamed protein product [Rodentolepis nana]